MTPRPLAAAVGLTLLLPLPGAAEYCVNWSAVVQKHAMESGHCWPTEKECRAYYDSRVLTHPGDFSGGCHYRPGLYPPTGSGAGTPGKPSAAEAAQKAKADAEKIKAQQAAKSKAKEQEFRPEKDRLLGELKIDAPSSQTFLLKAPPEADARKDLDRVFHESQTRKERGPDWENAPDRGAALPDVPPVPAPTAVDESASSAGETARAVLEALARSILEARETLKSQDAEIARLDETVRKEEAAQPEPPPGFKPPGESDALRRAREALARAKAARKETAAELARLEAQEKSAPKPQ